MYAFWSYSVTQTLGLLIELKVTSSPKGHDPNWKSLDQDHDQNILNEAFVSDRLTFKKDESKKHTLGTSVAHN